MLGRKGKIFKICKMETRSSRLKSTDKLNFQVVKVYFKNEMMYYLLKLRKISVIRLSTYLRGVTL